MARRTELVDSLVHHGSVQPSVGKVLKSKKRRDDAFSSGLLSSGKRKKTMKGKG
jgi:hypothetical protein